jgi:aldehyde dehydrogenase (NAD+)
MLSSVNALRQYYNTGATRPVSFRKERLKKLRQSILKYEKEIYNALHSDLKKSPEESWVTEVGFVIAEINNALRNISSWSQPERVPTNLVNLPSSSRIIKEPLGVVLVTAPWNYPFQLLINPVVGAVAAGNCVVIKPSEFAPATEGIIKKIIEESFASEHVLYVQGEGHKVIPELMNNFNFDHVFYTGSTAVGKIIYKMAAEKLTPVTLELGGKSPCIVEDDANIKVAGRRIAVTKFSNSGQMCVAPDYVLVHASRKDELIKAIKKALEQFYGGNPEESYSYGKIINEKQFDRLITYLSQGQLLYGGKWNREKLFIEPTLIDSVSMQDSVMKDEIFGPILPIFTFTTREEAKQIIDQNPDPLAFYVFTGSSRNERYWLENVSFGGGCVNNASWHLTNHHLPFGGKGFSGMGNYHGKASFDTFSHKKAIMKTPTWFDPAIKYPPFKGRLKLFKWVIR